MWSSRIASKSNSRKKLYLCAQCSERDNPSMHCVMYYIWQFTLLQRRLTHTCWYQIIEKIIQYSLDILKIAQCSLTFVINLYFRIKLILYSFVAYKYDVWSSDKKINPRLPLKVRRIDFACADTWLLRCTCFWLL